MTTATAEPAAGRERGEPLLAGLRVVELAGEIAAPFAAKLLGDAGAEVVKVEPPGGDPARAMAPFAAGAPDREASISFLNCNTSKRSAVLDVFSGAGRRLMLGLLEEADVLVTDFASDELSAAGLEPSALEERFPRLVIASLTPWGLEGEGSRAPSCVLTRAHAAGAAAGVRRNLGADGGAPVMAGGHVHEADAGFALALGAWAALLARERTGTGQTVEVAAAEAMATIDRVDISIAANDGGPPMAIRSGRGAFGGMLECADGHVIAVTPNPHQWRGMLRAMGDPEWAFEADGAPRDRMALGAEAQAAVAEWAGARGRDEVYRALQAESAPAGPVLRPSEVIESEQERMREFFEPLAHQVAGEGLYAQLPADWTGTRRAERSPAPLLGSSTAELLGPRLGAWTAAQARRAGVIG